MRQAPQMTKRPTRYGRLGALLVWAALSTSACKIEQGAPPAPRVTVPAQPAAPATSPPPPATQAPRAVEADAKRVHLPEEIAWQPWEKALAQAKAERKSLMLVVYAHWGPHCRDMSPVLARPDVVALSKRLVMVGQDLDERPSWLTERFDAPYGSYVPRVFFLTPDGQVREDLQSGNPRYPYFFAPQAPDTLIGAMQKAAGAG